MVACLSNPPRGRTELHLITCPKTAQVLAGGSFLPKLPSLSDVVTAKKDEKKRIEIFYPVFGKAFDSVNRRILVLHMDAIGKFGETARMCRKDLCSRTFSVRVAGE